MPIDNIAQMVTNQTRPAAPAAPAASPAVPVRQELPAEAKPESDAPPPREIMDAVSRIQDYVQNLRRDLQFRVDEDLNRVVVTVVDSDSGEVIRQIPGEEVIAVARSLDKLQQGLLLNQQA